MILVTGATGHFGKATIETLLNKGIPANTIAALVRDENKAADLKEKGITLKTGDYNDYASLVNAFTGVQKLLLVSGTDIENREKQQANSVKAAKEAGVKHIYYTSFERKNETESSPIASLAKSHIGTEEIIKASGLFYTIFRNNLYADILPLFMGEKVLETGIFYPAGNAKVGFTLRSDMAEAAANVLATEGHENKVYSISNTEEVSFHEIAETISEISGESVGYTSPAREIYVDTLTNAGVPAAYIGMFAGFAEAMKQGEFNSPKSDLEDLLGRKPISVKEFLKGVYTSKN